MITNFGVNRTFNTYEFKLKTLSNDSNIIHNYNDISFVTEATGGARWCVNLVCLTVLLPYQMAVIEIVTWEQKSWHPKSQTNPTTLLNLNAKLELNQNWCVLIKNLTSIWLFHPINMLVKKTVKIFYIKVMAASKLTDKILVKVDQTCFVTKTPTLRNLQLLYLNFETESPTFWRLLRRFPLPSAQPQIRGM